MDKHSSNLFKRALRNEIREFNGEELQKESKKLSKELQGKKRKKGHKETVGRTYGHRQEVKGGLDGLGRHFLEVHGAGLDLKKKDDLAICLQSFPLQIIPSVRPPATPEEVPACQQRLDMLEADMQHRLRCMSENGGMCIRDENNRRRRN